MNTDNEWMIYGAYGFTGSLIARRAKEMGMHPVLAGRNGEKLQTLAEELQLPYRTFSISAEAELDEGIDGMSLVLHCAGPYSRTAVPMLDACIRKRTHYLDITGELPVVEALLDRDQAARQAGITVLPSIGFDSAASNILAVKLREQLPDAEELETATLAGMNPSAGTVKTSIENADRPLKVIRNGELVRIKAPVIERRRIEGKERRLASVPLSDLILAYRASGIANITIFMEVAPITVPFLKGYRFLGKVLSLAPLRRFLEKQAEKSAKGPDPEERRNGRAKIWGMARNSRGHQVQALLETPETYEFTVLSALAAVNRILQKKTGQGILSPAEVFSSEMIDGVELRHLQQE